MITAYLQGGLGNQLFIIAAGWQQAQRLGCSLEVDTAFYKNQNLREVEVQKLGPPFIANFRCSTALSQKIKDLSGKLFPKLLKLYMEKSFVFENEINTIRPGTEIRGYFQSQKYFPEIAPALAQALFTAETTEHDKAMLAKYPDDSFIAIHVRRGDYVSNPDATAVHGITTRDYFEKALLKLRKGSSAPVLVFTDNPVEVEAELHGIEGLIFDAGLSKMSDFGTLKLFSQSKALAISNSTFSWWGAWMLQQRSPQAKVTYPNPWFSADIEFYDLIPSEWLSIPR